MEKCKGKNCNATDGIHHSAECFEEHNEAIAGWKPKQGDEVLCGEYGQDKCHVKCKFFAMHGTKYVCYEMHKNKAVYSSYIFCSPCGYPTLTHKEICERLDIENFNYKES